MFEGIRDFIVQAIELKYNCFLLMPLIDSFPQVRPCLALRTRYQMTRVRVITPSYIYFLPFFFPL